MRVVVRVVAVGLGLIGLVVLAAGVVGASYVGRDDTVPLLTSRVSTGGVGLVTAPDLLAVFGPTVHVRVTAPDDELFVGVAHRSDLESYLGTRRHAELSGYAWPRSVSTRESTGSTSVTAPGRLDWWVASATGRGVAELTWPMTDGHFAIAALPADGRAPFAADLRVGLEIDGLFGTALAAAAVGLGGVAVAVLAVVSTRRRAPEPATVVPMTGVVA